MINPLFESILIAGGFACAAALQPGPLQAFLFSRVAMQGWRRTLPASLSPLLSDGPIIFLVLVVLKQVPPSMERALQAAGGLLLLWFAASTFRLWKSGSSQSTQESSSVPRTVLQAVLVNLLNPNPYLSWSLVLGPLFLKTLKLSIFHGVVFLAVFYGTMVIGLALIIILFGILRVRGQSIARHLILVSAAMLLILGLYQIFRSFRVT